ncbi:MAG: Nif3-like dinuclear metal center hexameric protein [bacterium]
MTTLITVSDIVKVLNYLVPEELALEWDNVGLQVGNWNKCVKNILISLDLTKQVLNDAARLNINLIITHHPLIFSPLKKITSLDSIGSLVIELIRKDICLYVAHTNLDIVKDGVNDVLAKKIGLCNVEYLVDDANSRDKGLGRVGQLAEQMKLGAMGERVKKCLGLTQIRLIGNRENEIKNVAVCSGSGASLINLVARKKVDLYVTGDVKYHEARLAEEIGLLVIDIGHFGSEVVVLPVFAESLRSEFKRCKLDVEIIVHNQEVDPFWYI